MTPAKARNDLPPGIVIRRSLRKDEGPALAELLDVAFPSTFEGRTFYKQQPHLRLLAFEQERLIGHVGLDLRAITIGGQVYEIVGIIDLCVARGMRRKAIGSHLLGAAEGLGTGRSFSVLFADDHRIYQANGYDRIRPAVTRWLAIDNLRSHSVIERDLSGLLMAKSLGFRPWPHGKIDLLGHLF